ncbi:MAG: sigma-54-dependent Fis family transcriptional regulator, partial [Planctomycetota bacterium]
MPTGRREGRRRALRRGDNRVRSAVMMTAEDLARLAIELMSAATEGSDDTLVAAVRDAVGAGSAVLWRPEAPAWRAIAAVPTTAGTAPPEAAVEALDRDTAYSAGGWSAGPVGRGDSPQPDVLALRGCAADDCDAAARLLASARRLAATAGAEGRRAERLGELVSLSLDWGATSDTVALLERMAESATRLFSADRATVFLWDKPAARLVGRPALGLPDNTLVIPEDAGVVGRVVKTGEPLRTSADEAGAVDRSTDEASGYRTKSLLCVPLDAPSGERLGAFELINKVGAAGFSDEDERGLAEFARLAAVAVANAQQVEELVEQRDALVDQAASGVEMLGEAPAIDALRSTIRRVADADLAVLVLGENGTGKEVVARSLHFQSRRRSEPLLAVNCAAIAESLLESELFGHEAGAFTDAREARAGKFELADGGTLLLDEIGDMSPGGQAKLLRVLEDKTVVRVGGAEERKVDVRVVAATNRDLSARVAEGRFREDLFYRLCVVTLELPPLRERGDDPVLLAEHFLRQFCQARGRRTPKLSAAAKRR